MKSSMLFLKKSLMIFSTLIFSLSSFAHANLITLSPGSKIIVRPENGPTEIFCGLQEDMHELPLCRVAKERYDDSRYITTRYIVRIGKDLQDTFDPDDEGYQKAIELVKKLRTLNFCH